MKRFTDAGRAAVEAGNLYSALSLALTLPDICGGLEDPGTGKVKARYVRWCKEWLEPIYTKDIGHIHVFLTAEECYRLRNSLVHSGSSEITARDDNRLQRIVFVAWEASHCVQMANVLQLSTSVFSRDVFNAADRWDAAMTDNANVQREKESLLVIQSASFSDNGFTFFSPEDAARA